MEDEKEVKEKKPKTTRNGVKMMRKDKVKAQRT